VHRYVKMCVSYFEPFYYNISKSETDSRERSLRWNRHGLFVRRIYFYSLHLQHSSGSRNVWHVYIVMITSSQVFTTTRDVIKPTFTFSVVAPRPYASVCMRGVTVRHVVSSLRRYASQQHRECGNWWAVSTTWRAGQVYLYGDNDILAHVHCTSSLFIRNLCKRHNDSLKTKIFMYQMYIMLVLRYWNLYWNYFNSQLCQC
jgi:hypothetical protein